MDKDIRELSGILDSLGVDESTELVSGLNIVNYLGHADGLRTRDGLAPTGFSMAGADQVYHPATARIDAAGRYLIGIGSRPGRWLRRWRRRRR